MPLYDYKCEKCEKIIEIMHSFNKENNTKCPDCNGDLSRMISAPSFQFKGTGWYITDYKNKSQHTCSGSCCPAGGASK